MAGLASRARAKAPDIRDGVNGPPCRARAQVPRNMGHSPLCIFLLLTLMRHRRRNQKWAKKERQGLRSTHTGIYHTASQQKLLQPLNKYIIFVAVKVSFYLLTYKLLMKEVVFFFLQCILKKMHLKANRFYFLTQNFGNIFSFRPIVHSSTVTGCH